MVNKLLGILGLKLENVYKTCGLHYYPYGKNLLSLPFLLLASLFTDFLRNNGLGLEIFKGSQMYVSHNSNYSRYSYIYTLLRHERDTLD